MKDAFTELIPETLPNLCLNNITSNNFFQEIGGIILGHDSKLKIVCWIVDIITESSTFSTFTVDEVI